MAVRFAHGTRAESPHSPLFGGQSQILGWRSQDPISAFG
jgi:hypothetical protein